MYLHVYTYIILTSRAKKSLPQPHPWIPGLERREGEGGKREGRKWRKEEGRRKGKEGGMEK